MWRRIGFKVLGFGFFASVSHWRSEASNSTISLDVSKSYEKYYDHLEENPTLIPQGTRIGSLEDVPMDGFKRFQVGDVGILVFRVSSLS